MTLSSVKTIVLLVNEQQIIEPDNACDLTCSARTKQAMATPVQERLKMRVASVSWPLPADSLHAAFSCSAPAAWHCISHAACESS